MKIIFFLLCSLSTIYGSDIHKTQKQKKVVLIHGFMNHRSMSSFNFLLKKNDWDVENYKYSSRNKTIEEHAANLVHKLSAISKKDQPINFITFSQLMHFIHNAHICTSHPFNI